MGPNERRLIGLASVPEKRLGHGAVPDMNLAENSFLTAFKRLGLIKNSLIDSIKTSLFADKITSTAAPLAASSRSSSRIV